MSLPGSRCCCHFRLRNRYTADRLQKMRGRQTATSLCHHYPELKGQKQLVLSGGRKLISGR